MVDGCWRLRLRRELLLLLLIAHGVVQGRINWGRDAGCVAVGVMRETIVTERKTFIAAHGGLRWNLLDSYWRLQWRLEHWSEKRKVTVALCYQESLLDVPGAGGKVVARAWYWAEDFNRGHGASDSMEGYWMFMVLQRKAVGARPRKDVQPLLVQRRRVNYFAIFFCFQERDLLFLVCGWFSLTNSLFYFLPFKFLPFPLFSPLNFRLPLCRQTSSIYKWKNISLFLIIWSPNFLDD